jgi:serine/threonine protein kinase
VNGERPHASWELGEGEALVDGRTVVKRIGGGTRYEVYLVWDDVLFSLAVAKVLRPDQAGDDAARRGLRYEAELLEQLRHPVVVRGFDAVLDGPRPHVLIEHLEGPSLRRLIKRGGPLPLDQVLPLALHVATAIHYMAQRGYVHLDVKPDNIIMGIPPRLIDLSLARTFERATQTTVPTGTDAYMAPEQCDPAGLAALIGPASDVWGLGATLHHAIAGAPPFPRPAEARQSPVAATRFPQLVDEPEPLPAGVPGPLRELIARALRRDPSERPSAADLAQGLEPLVDELPAKLKLGRRGARFQ